MGRPLDVVSYWYLQRHVMIVYPASQAASPLSLKPSFDVLRLATADDKTRR